MDNKSMTYRFIISGGGTGGHIFPAIAVADEIKQQHPSAQILFVGAEGRMEMKKVPESGYEIVGLPIRGLQRKLTVKNLWLPYYVLRSVWLSFQLVKKHKPHAVIGFGGYASAPLLFAAALKGIPVFIQEQNSYAGLTNKVLAKWAKFIFVAYENMQSFFPISKLKHTGNPIRKGVLNALASVTDTKTEWGFDVSKKVVLVIGGSLGATAVNNAIKNNLDALQKLGIQLLWQTGETHFQKFSNLSQEGVVVLPFIKDMAKAYGAADIIVSRSGAIAVSELAIVGKPVILVPSPNVTEDHQTKNAMALVHQQAAVLVKDAEVNQVLVNVLEKLMNNEAELTRLSTNIQRLAKPEAAKEIVNYVIAVIK
jgi:UDP-N-acetylglucosamine--N-acetylmuramyl-(pentapeptide) pyrophosphoryl-undecaprenol N-acetylglucosamine transferase